MRKAEEIVAEVFEGWGGVSDELRLRLLSLAAQAQREAIEEAASRFEAVVSRGYSRASVNPLKNGERCVHGRYEWEDCLGCYDEALSAEIETIRALPHREG